MTRNQFLLIFISIILMSCSSLTDRPDKSLKKVSAPSGNFFGIENEENYIQVSRRKLYELVQPFYEEILKWIHSSIENSGYKNLIGKVVVFTGGASQIDGLTTMVNNNYNFNFFTNNIFEYNWN